MNAPVEDRVIRLTVQDGPPQRIDVYIAAALPAASRTKVQESIRLGAVRVNDRQVRRPSVRITAGDRIAWTVPKPRLPEVEPEPIPLAIPYEDSRLLVVNKPAGMPVHPGTGHHSGTLVHALLHHTGSPSVAAHHRPKDQEIGLSSLYDHTCIRPGIVHRLDKDTTGLLVVAKDDVTHRALALQFAQRTARRTYNGIVWGVPNPPEGRLVTQIGRSPKDRRKMAVVPAPRGKRAATRYRVQRPLTHVALMAFSLETGRTHQIRVHAEHIGHPILGDPTYGGRAIRRGPTTSRRRATFRHVFSRLGRQALHAGSLGFEHPHSGQAIDVTCPLPDDMLAALQMLQRADQ